MKHFLNITMVFTIFFIMIGCCTKKVVTSDNVLGVSMKYELVIENAKNYQIDSLIMADTLPQLAKWPGSIFVDYNTNERVTKRVFVKQYSKDNEVVYVITGNTEPYNVVKRIKK